MSLITTLTGTLRRVQRGFEYKTDIRQYGVIEKWTIPTDVDNLTSDCEEHAIACRMILKDLGIDSRLVYCKDETGAGHLVLEVEGWILDNRQTRVVSRDKLERKGYEFISISGFNSGDDWRLL
jgi:predicted transglutaminase-like cysteine proteinase